MSDEALKFYDLLDRIDKMCRQTGELSLTEIERMAVAEDIRPSAILDELAMINGFTIDYAEGKVICR